MCLARARARCPGETADTRPATEFQCVGVRERERERESACAHVCALPTHYLIAGVAGCEAAASEEGSSEGGTPIFGAGLADAAAPTRRAYRAYNCPGDVPAI